MGELEKYIDSLIKQVKDPKKKKDLISRLKASQSKEQPLDKLTGGKLEEIEKLKKKLDKVSELNKSLVKVTKRQGEGIGSNQDLTRGVSALRASKRDEKPTAHIKDKPMAKWADRTRTTTTGTFPEKESKIPVKIESKFEGEEPKKESKLHKLLSTVSAKLRKKKEGVKGSPMGKLETPKTVPQHFSYYGSSKREKEGKGSKSGKGAMP